MLYPSSMYGTRHILFLITLNSMLRAPCSMLSSKILDHIRKDLLHPPEVKEAGYQ